jgi:adenylate cyclase, class 2
METEWEATFWPIDKEEIRARLKAAGATLIYPERFMRRVNLYPPDEEYANRAWVRVRDEGDRITLSLKERLGDNSHIEHQGEIELVIDSFERAQELLRLLGCRDKNYQETKRELWKLGGAEVTIDEWPWLEPFVEIEGISEEQVKDISIRLGFLWENARFDTADKIYAQKYNVEYQYVNRKIPRLTFDGPNPFQNEGEAGIVA